MGKRRRVIGDQGKVLAATQGLYSDKPEMFGHLVEDAPLCVTYTAPCQDMSDPLGANLRAFGYVPELIVYSPAIEADPNNDPIDRAGPLRSIWADLVILDATEGVFGEEFFL